MICIASRFEPVPLRGAQYTDLTISMCDVHARCACEGMCNERGARTQKQPGQTTVAAAGGVEDRVSDGISDSRVGCKDDSEMPDETDFPDAGHDDMAEYI